MATGIADRRPRRRPRRAGADLGPGYLRYREEMRVRAEGTPARAVITNRTPTSASTTRPRSSSVWKFAPRTAAQRASVRRILSVAEAPAFAPGQEIAVR